MENEQKTMLAVLAHPDDESFGMGGTLALYSKRGVSVHLVCATRGEVGDVDPNMLEGFPSIGDLREHELRCASEHLGLASVHFLGYRDSGMPGSPDNIHPDALAAAPLEEVAARVTNYIRKLRPQVVLTFDPIGGYRHPDHIAIQQATVRAFHAAGDPEAFPGEFPPYQPQKLYFHTFSRRLMALVVRLLPLYGQDPRHFGQNKDIDLISLASEHFPVHARIDYREVSDAKDAASNCHASQLGMGPPRGLLGWAFRRGAGMETFMRAYPEAASNLREDDLFSGINGLEK